jgi:tRNA (Thr-GGU) A37 N-methylase
MSIRSLSAFPKRPVSAYEHGIFTERHDLRPHNPVKITPFEFDRLSMDSVCSKMTESIILSPGFWDKVDEIPEPLSFKSF